MREDAGTTDTTAMTSSSRSPQRRPSPRNPATPAPTERPLRAVPNRAPVATVLSVIGARPEIIQATPVSRALRQHCREILVHTGQHYDAKMSGDQIAATNLPEPDVNLGVGSGSTDDQVKVGTERLIELIGERRPDVVLVRGDTSATLAGALAAERTGVPLIHVEAGLRSHRHDMPEEYNRIETDKRSDLLLAPVPGAVKNLQAERINGEIYMTGDPLCDILEGLRDEVVPVEGEYLLATVHRNYNTDDPVRLQGVLDSLAKSPWTVKWPLHPRTAAALKRFELRLPSNVEVLETGDLPRDAQPRARCPGDRDRLGWRAAGGLPLGRSLHHAARGDRVDRHGGPWLEHARRRRSRAVRGCPRGAAARGAPADLRRRTCQRADR